MSKKHKRLVSTKNFFDMNISSSKKIHDRVTSSIDKNIRYINKLIKITNTTDNSDEILLISKKLLNLLKKSNYDIQETNNKGLLVQQLKKYRGLELILRQNAATSCIVSLYASFEEFIRQVMLKYYEDDVRRLNESNKMIKYSEIVPLVINQELILRNIAYDLVDQVIRGSIDKWAEQLTKMGFKELVFSDTTRELILLRNSIVHNSARASKYLVEKFPNNYEIWKRINISDDKLDIFFSSTHKTITWIQQEYNRMYRVRYSNWNEPNYGIVLPNDNTISSAEEI